MTSIKSLDFVAKTLYESKFKEWLHKVNIKVVLNNNNWELRSNDFNIQIALTSNKSGASFLKTKFSIGLIHFSNTEKVKDILEAIDHYSGKPDLVGFIFTKPVSHEEDLFLNISYMFNIFEEMGLLDYLNFIYNQVEEIKEDFEYKLALKLLSFSNLEEDKDVVIDEDEEEDDEDEFIEDEDVISPYDVGGR